MLQRRRAACKAAGGSGAVTTEGTVNAAMDPVGSPATAFGNSSPAVTASGGGMLFAAAPSTAPASGATVPAAEVEGPNNVRGYPRAQRPRRGDDEPFSSAPSSFGPTPWAPTTGAVSSMEARPTTPATPGMRWRCSICGLLIDDRNKAYRHCATAHGAQPCEPVEVPTPTPTSGTTASRPAAPTPTIGVATVVPGSAPQRFPPPPASMPASVLPPVAPIFSATRGLVPGLGGGSGVAAATAPPFGLGRGVAATTVGAADIAEQRGPACSGPSLEEQVQRLHLSGSESLARAGGESDSEL